MSGANHIVGGTVFTGIFASFWNVNVFEKPQYLFFTAFFAILPDVDHLKSPIGKLFYPVAKWLNLKYGHRTITHSLLCYFSLFALVAVVENLSGGNGNVSLIFGFAYFSHLLFDMLTKQGVPLFWPFMRNPCVIPGNPDLRLKSSHLQTEAVVFVVFILLGLTCQNLFAQGFWTSYNKLFTDLKHLHQEARQNENLLHVEYEFSHEGKTHSGNGHLIKSTETESIIFANSKFVRITNEHRIHKLTPTKTEKKLVTNDLLFFNVSPDSLQTLIASKPILNLKLQSTSAFSYIKDNKPQASQSAEFEYVYNPVISFLHDSLENSLANKMEILKYELQKSQSEKSTITQSRYKLNAQIDSLTSSISRMDIYQREKAVEKLAALKQELSQLKSTADESGKIELQLKQVQKEFEQRKKVLVSGYLQVASL